jgi:hypothetical protein
MKNKLPGTTLFLVEACPGCGQAKKNMKTKN